MCVDISTIRKIYCNQWLVWLFGGRGVRQTHGRNGCGKGIFRDGGQPTYTWTYTSPDFSGPGRMNLGTAFAVEPGVRGPVTNQRRRAIIFALLCSRGSMPLSTSARKHTGQPARVHRWGVSARSVVAS